MRQELARRSGFTLVELLVVIGIIALLISILLPALNKARGQAQMVQCSSNMRAIGQGLNLYLNASKGRLPPLMVATATAPAVWPSGFFWANVLVRNKFVPTSIGTTATGAKNQLSGVFTCPSGTDTLISTEGAVATDFPISGINDYLRAHNYVADATDTDTSNTDDRVGTHYMLNARKPNSTTFTGAPDTSYVPPFYAFSDTTGRTYLNNSKYSHTLGQIHGAATMVMMVEGNSYDLNRAPRLAARHQRSRDGINGLTNILFFDGHVAAFSTKPYYDAFLRDAKADLTCFFMKNHGVSETRFRLNE